MIADVEPLTKDLLPHEPTALLLTWIEEAVEAGLAVPHAATIATADASGTPSARTLLLKDVDERGLWFASVASSRKGRELNERPWAELVFHWREFGRQLRFSGPVVPGGRSISDEDFRARGMPARAGVLAGRQGSPRGDASAAEARLEAARHALERQPELTAPDWQAYVLFPRHADVLQLRGHAEPLRFAYKRGADGDWTLSELWP